MASLSLQINIELAQLVKFLEIPLKGLKINFNKRSFIKITTTVINKTIITATLRAIITLRKRISKSCGLKIQDLRLRNFEFKGLNFNFKPKTCEYIRN
jgi:hypothetical protein